MDFSSSPPKRRAAENIVPMINVVFLLLIFFLMSAQIAPPRPVDLTAPASEARTTPRSDTELYIAQDGVAYFAGLSGPLALDALAADAPARLKLHVDAALPASEFAQFLTQFGAWGIGNIDVITERR